MDQAAGNRPSVPDNIYKPGDACGPYRIDAFLDAGGFSEVYAGTNQITDRRAALKVLLSERAKVKEVLDRFQREIQLLARLQHVNVVSFYEAGIDGARIWAAMELLEGRSLRVHLHDRGQLDVVEALNTLFEIACGVAAAQEVGVVHRDLKPENVFITKPGAAKVLDFGIAKFEGWGFQSTGRGRRQMLGTPSYMTPEQIAGETPEFASDVYQAGLIGYEMLAGRHPWSYDNGDFPTQMQICELQTRAAPRSLSTFGVREDVAALIAKALEKKPEDRFATMAVFAAEVWRLLATIRNERAKDRRREDQRNPAGADGQPLGPTARRAYEPVQTPATQETPPPVPRKRVELRVLDGGQVSRRGERAGAEHQATAPIDAPTPPKRAPVNKTLPLEDVVRASRATAKPTQRETAPMPPPSVAPKDHAPSWLLAANGAIAANEKPLREAQTRPARVRDVEVRERDDEPMSVPQWLSAMMITSAVASVTIAAYFMWPRAEPVVPQQSSTASEGKGSTAAPVEAAAIVPSEAALPSAMAIEPRASGSAPAHDEARASATPSASATTTRVTSEAPAMKRAAPKTTAAPRAQNRPFGVED